MDNMPEVDLIPAWAEQYMDLERSAPALSFFAHQVLPGLLQTETYARAAFGSSEQVGACVEVAAHPRAVHVRDSKDPEGPALALAPATWAAFTGHVGS
ncbi:Scr1 family TA system antitoxin-like transcriptional regulator [Streptomyces sp. NPDC048680]|uniref:DUF397 domain-containing protein n=1 Tax=Streptomyces sp. NPDC048680 TaxID=3155492 RepID=UPI00341ED50F